MLVQEALRDPPPAAKWAVSATPSAVLLVAPCTRRMADTVGGCCRCCGGQVNSVSPLGRDAN